MGSVTLPVTILEQDLIVEIEYTVVGHHVGEGPEYDWTLENLWHDPRVAMSEEFEGRLHSAKFHAERGAKALELPEWLKEAIATIYDEEIYHRVHEEETGG